MARTGLGEGGLGDVIGPASSVDNNLAVFDGITGKLIKDGGNSPTFSSLALSNIGVNSVVFGGPGNVLSDDPSNFVWNNTTKRLGINNTAPAAALSFSNLLNAKKISLFDGISPNLNERYGFGVRFGAQVYQIGSPFASHIFQAAVDGTSSRELFTIAGTGNVGIGIISPAKPLALLHIKDDADISPLNITERSAEPTAPTANDLYIDDGTNTVSGNPGWRRYTGAVWEDLNT